MGGGKAGGGEGGGKEIPVSQLVTNEGRERGYLDTVLCKEKGKKKALILSLLPRPQSEEWDDSWSFPVANYPHAGKNKCGPLSSLPVLPVCVAYRCCCCCCCLSLVTRNSAQARAGLYVPARVLVQYRAAATNQQKVG